MYTNSSALIVPAQSPASNQAAGLTFQNAVKPPLEIFDAWFWIWFSVIALILSIVGYFLWRRWAKNQLLVPVAPPIPPHDKARRLLEQALALLSEPKPFSTAVSDILRTYLEERFDFHAPDRTTDEFLLELQNTNLLTTEQKLSLANFLSSCDLVKFAKYEPTEVELMALHASACQLVNETEPSPLGAENSQSQIANRQTDNQPPPVTTPPDLPKPAPADPAIK